MDKLAKITKLKEEVAGGKQLEKNQLEMISKEKELTEELKMLQLWSTILVVLGLQRTFVLQATLNGMLASLKFPLGKLSLQYLWWPDL